uniref:Uncharacterized protein n=3 Tax=Calcidiscus leptoporus TaxID=127549 RepID=A0A7S0JGW5_9EUKA|mmetsp:Transcript_5821/g.13543  ORF Transcript_5821/g.13543 Transcript_5821/m.13543 type:complete len:263 (+) Transcript_5821:167-955(+)|eukprot:CAMPEP_0119353162 /NCGR_PEP_ID=MMETSP1334-20130426/2390_1 /TAXON_ID=127549 /ORGANISM="Calcidiscus leptoporus, Strain RCC1130" /LENGTH=262 /DNA_ID=CAMNT_0007366397 /DNA_START=141 /DNA_END=929 /DNA_ORIENTATION=+
MATDGHRLLPRTSCAQKSKRCICCARTAPPGAHVALVFVLMEGACSGVRGYPLVGGLLSSEGEEQAVAADSVAKLLGKQAAEEKLPCPKHRPLPPIDPVEGLSWLDHVKAAPLPCFNELNLGWEEIMDADAPKLVRLISAGVTTLTLYQNHLGDEAAVQLSAALRDSMVHELDLAHNQIGNEGAVALARSLARAPALRGLRLNGNRLIGDEAVLAFASELSQQPGLALDELWLASPAISEDAIKQLRATWLDTGRDPDALHL